MTEKQRRTAERSADRMQRGFHQGLLACMATAGPWEHRLRLAAATSAILLWSSYAFLVWTPSILDRNGQVKGWDFPQFYALGDAVVDGRVDLLGDGDELGARASRALGGAYTYQLVPLYGPQVAALFAPFALVPYGWALGLWILATAFIAAGCGWVLLGAAPGLQRYRATTTWLVAGSPIVFLLVCYGQISILAAAAFTIGFAAFRTNRPFVAGLALGTLAYKPQLGLALAVVFLASREWRTIAGAVVSVLGQLGVAWSVAGWGTIRAYVDTLIHIGDVIPLIQEKDHLLQSLHQFFRLLVPWPAAALAGYLVASALVLAATCRIWQSAHPLPVRYASLILATVLVNPHLYVYDLVILMPVWFLLVEPLVVERWQTGGRTVTILLGLLYVIPLLGPVLAHLIHVQPTAIVISALLWRLWRQRPDTVRAMAPVPTATPLSATGQ